MTVPIGQAVQLTRRYQAGLTALTTQTARRLVKAWDDLDGYDDTDVDTFVNAATPVTTTAQRSAVALTGGYIGVLLATRLPGLDPTAYADKVPTLTPFLAYWSALKDGQRWEDAQAAGRRTAGSIGNTAVQSAARGASADIDQAQERIVGWQRTLVGPSCEFCATAATQRYHSAESADFGHGHGGVDYCDCVVVPIIGTVNPGRVINRDLLDATRSSDTAYVNPDGSPASRPDAPVDA